jgi:hypothetical protein
MHESINLKQTKEKPISKKINFDDIFSIYDGFFQKLFIVITISCINILISKKSFDTFIKSIIQIHLFNRIVRFVPEYMRTTLNII